MMMFALARYAAPLAFLFLFATGFAFAATTAEAAVGFVGSTALRRTSAAAQQPAMPGGDSEKCTPTKTTVRC